MTRLRHAARSSGPTSRTPSSCPTCDQARARPDRHRRPMIGMRYPYEVNLVGDAAATLRALLPLLRAQDRPRLAGDDREATSRAGGDVMDAEAHGRGRPGQPDAAVRRAVRPAARRRDRHRRLRLGRQLVRPPRSGSAATCAARCPARWPPWARRCRTRSARSSPTPTGRHRARRRRRDADERHRRAHHHRRATGRSGPTRGWSSRCCTTTTSTRSPGSCARWAARPSSSSPRPCPMSPTPPSPARLGLRRDHRRRPRRSSAAAWDEALAADRPVRPRRALRPRRAADPAARHLRADDGHGPGARSRATPTGGA